MKKIKIISLIILICMAFGLFTSCTTTDDYNEYNAKLYSDVNDWIDETFLKENRVNAYYRNEDYIEGESDLSDEYIELDGYPSSLIFIITDEDEYSSIFTKANLDVNFDEEMVILYICSDVYLLKYYLGKMSIEDNVLNVNLKLEYSNKNGAVMPYQRCMVIKMQKEDIKEVKITK